MFWLIGILLIGAFLILVVNWARSLPVAYAWYPNSHEKMTCYALDLLDQGQPRTLLGWLLGYIRRSPANSAYKYHLEGQLRRASVEEDMNSYIGFETLGGVVPVKKTAGANGAYHFFNPRTGEGLSDSDWALMSAALASGSQPPMPSALERAVSAENKDPGWFWTGQTAWHYDKENRNYTIEDATRYFDKGYTHLAFYALGRVAHLLQDMSTPAHVRNDSHSGLKKPVVGGFIDVPDPLEEFAGREDGYDMHWDFDWARVYSSAFMPMFSQSQGAWSLRRGDFQSCDVGSMFDSLAEWTYRRYYSYNTIPGNGDSHAIHESYSYTEAQDKLLRNTQQFDRKNCDVNVDMIWEVLWEVLGKFGEASNRMMQILQLWEKAGPGKLDITEICERKSRSLPDLENVLAKIARFREVWVLDDRALKELPDMQKLRWSYNDGFEKLRIPDLSSAAKDAQGSGDIAQCMRQWVELVPESTMIKLFDGRHGPFHITTEILTRQWMETQTMAIAYTALLLANWFEERYLTGNSGLWLNKDAGGLTSEPKVEVIDVKEIDAEVPKGAVTIGFTNNLPATLDFTLELEMLEEGTDPEIWENGLELEMTWGRQVPQLAAVGVEQPQPVAEGPLSLDSPSASHDGVEWKSRREWSMQVLPTIQLTKERPKPEEPLVCRGLDPYNIINLGTPVPYNVVSRSGGIRREEEDRLVPLQPTPQPAEEQPVPFSPAPAEDQWKLNAVSPKPNAVFVRFVPNALEPIDEGTP